MDKESQRRYREPTKTPPVPTPAPAPTATPKAPGAIRSFIGGFWNDWSGANLTPEEWMQSQSVQPQDRMNWLHRTNMPPELRQKLQRYYHNSHGANRSTLYRLFRDLARQSRLKRK